MLIEFIDSKSYVSFIVLVYFKIIGGIIDILIKKKNILKADNNRVFYGCVASVIIKSQ